MIIKDNTDERIEKYKQILGISGDVYIDDLHRIESLTSHRFLLLSNDYPSTAETIEEAEAERGAFEQEMERRGSAEPELTVEDTLLMLEGLGVNTDD